MSETVKNVQAACLGESQAYRKYLAFAKIADREGYSQIARLFRAVATAEQIHACTHMDAMQVQDVGSTKENLKNSIEGEFYEISRMYPAYIEQADKDGMKEASRSFSWALETEKIHERLYKDALKSIEAGTDLPAKNFYICDVCGYTAEEEAPEKCPICGAVKEKFSKIE